MNRNLNPDQFAEYVPQHGATDLKENAAMQVAGGGHLSFGGARGVPPAKNTLTAFGAMHNAMILGATSPN